MPEKPKQPGDWSEDEVNRLVSMGHSIVLGLSEEGMHSVDIYCLLLVTSAFHLKALKMVWPKEHHAAFDELAKVLPQLVIDSGVVEGEKPEPS